MKILLDSDWLRWFRPMVKDDHGFYDDVRIRDIDVVRTRDDFEDEDVRTS